MNTVKTDPSSHEDLLISVLSKQPRMFDESGDVSDIKQSSVSRSPIDYRLLTLLDFRREESAY